MKPSGDTDKGAAGMTRGFRRVGIEDVLRIGILLAVVVTIFSTSACASTQPAGEVSAPLPSETDIPPAIPATTSVPTFTPSATPVPCDRASRGEVTRIELNSELLPPPYTVSVYTPPCYGKEDGLTYPVLYLLHGQNMDDTFWLSLGAAELADEMVAQGRPPFLMVMPYEMDNFDPPSESKFAEAVLSELIPWVEDNYAVCTDRDCRAIGGVSRGGGWAMRLAARNFDTFGAVGAHSMGLLQGDAWQIQKHLETRTREEYPRIYIDRGEDDFLYEGIDYFVGVLVDNDIPHEFHINPGQHDKDYWQAHVAEYLQWYVAGWEGKER